MTQQTGSGDPLEFMRNMWSKMGFSLPGMVTPTLDIDELDKRITDMKAVENWLKMNLSMLQMTIQGLEMQRATLAAVRAMSQQATDSTNPEAAAETNPFANAAAMWPWNFMTPPPPPGTERTDTTPPAGADAPPSGKGRPTPDNGPKT